MPDRTLVPTSIAVSLLTQAADACVSVTYGFITKADVAKLIAGR
jgi:hypothetical protein